MLLSMTGFGKATCEYNSKKIVIEIKSLNSKQLDLSARLHNSYKSKEIEVRNEIQKQLLRGKVDISIWIDSKENVEAAQINTPIVKNYCEQVQKIGHLYGGSLPTEQLLAIVLKFPDVFSTDSNKEISDEEWAIILNGVKSAITDLQQFRIQEGKVLEKDITQRINTILGLLGQIEPFEKQRIEIIKNRIKQNLNDFIPSENIDKNRFEQELIYYLEKIDITEEKVRLTNHCNYFLQNIAEAESNGRKLGFVTQEIGREINTIGSKANDSDIQQLVILMKDELEKIKEQLMNIL